MLGNKSLAIGGPLSSDRTVTNVELAKNVTYKFYVHNIDFSAETYSLKVSYKSNGSVVYNKSGLPFDQQSTYNINDFAKIQNWVGGGSNSQTIAAVLDYYVANQDGLPSGQSSAKINGTVRTQSGSPVANATVVGYAALYPNKSTNGARDQLESLADPTPPAYEKISKNPDLLKNYWNLEETDSFVSTHTKEAIPETAPWVDEPNLDGTAAIDLPADEEIVLAAWSGPVPDCGILAAGGHEYDCQMGATHVPDSPTVVIERIGPKGSITERSTVQLDEIAGGGLADPDRLNYETVDLQPGFYYIHEEGAPKGIPRKVGKSTEIIDRYQQTTDSKLSDRASEVAKEINNDRLKRVTTETNASGEFTLSVPANAKVVSIQTYKAGSIADATGTAPANMTQRTIVSNYNDAINTDPSQRTAAQRRIVNSSVYFPSITRTVEPPADDVRITMYELSAPPGANVSALQEELDRLRQQLRDQSFSTVTNTIQQQIPKTSIEELRNLYAELAGVVDQYQPVEDRYLEISNRTSIADPSELSRDELTTEMRHMNQALREVDATGMISEPDVEKSASNVSVSWTVPDMDLSEAKVSVIAHYANGTSRAVSEEYIAIDSGLAADSVRVESFPLGETDPASVSFELRVAGDGELRNREDAVKNPTFSGDLPRINSISLSSAVPGPDENVTATVTPAQFGSFKEVKSVTVYGPDGNQLGTSPIRNGTTFSFTTDGAGIHTIEATLVTTGGTEVQLPVRIKAKSTDTDRPPTISARDSPIGMYALVGGADLEEARIETDSGGQEISVTGVVESNRKPTEVDLHLEELSIPGTATTTITLVEEGSRERLGYNVPVLVHMQKPSSEDYQIWREGQPVRKDGNKWGEVSETSQGITVDTYTESDGSVEIKKVSDPTLRQRLDWWVATRLSSVGVSSVTIGVGPIAQLAALVGGWSA